MSLINPFSSQPPTRDPAAPSLDVRSFSTIVGNIAAAVQGGAAQLLDYSIGSVLRALAEAEAGVGLWLQANILKVLSATRLATSQGTQVDSFIQDWGTARLGAALSAGQVTFSRFTPTQAVTILVGTQVRTADGTQSFQVIADTANGNFSSTVNGYLLPINVTSVSCTVQSLNPGFASNVAANTVTVLVTSTVGVDFCNNAGPMSGGSDTETDEQVRTRFPGYIASIARGTNQAIINAIASLKLGMQATIMENVNQDGSTHNGFLYITVDDGTGFPPQTTLNAASLAAVNYVAGGIFFGVFAPVVLSVNVAAVVTSAAGYDHPTIVATVTEALSIYINTLPLGTSLSFSALCAVGYEASPGVVNLSVLLNGSGADIAATPINVIKIGSLTVS